jgi:hypothetical protein
MTAIIVPSRRLIQPQGRVDVASEWHESLLSAYNGGSGFFDVRLLSNYSVQNNLSVEAARVGVGAAGNASNKSAFIAYPEVSISGATVLAVVQGGNGLPDDRAFSLARGTDAANYLAIGTGATFTTKARVVTVVNNVAGTATTVTTKDVFGPTPAACALRWEKGVGTTAFVDGALDAFAANTENSNFPASRSGLCALVRNSTAAQFGGILLAGFAFNRALSNDECIELTRNPWQVFRASPRRLYFDVPGGGSDINGSMAAVENTIDTFSASGTVLVEGILNATENTTDTFTSSGTVLVSGSMAATETTVDVFTATGSESTTGVLDATEGTVDTFSASGTIPISGSLTATENTVDVFNATNIPPTVLKTVNSKWLVSVGATSGTVQLQMASEVNGVDVTLQDNLFFLKYRKI